MPSTPPQPRSSLPRRSPAGILGVFAASATIAALPFIVPLRPPAPNPRATASAYIPRPRVATETFSAAGLAALWLHPDREYNRDAVAQVLATFSTRPAIARELSEAILAQDPDDVRGRQFALAAALAQTGAIDAALAFAENSPATLRAQNLATVFHLAAAQNPETARDLAVLLQDLPPGPAYSAVLHGWAGADPSQVAHYALSLPQSERRSLALAIALEPWLQRDPMNAAQWISRLENPRERDAALAAWIAKTDSVHRPAATALRLASAIHDESLRLEATRHALREWAAIDPIAAKQFLDASPDFTAAQRIPLLAALTPLPTDCPSPP